MPGPFCPLCRFSHEMLPWQDVGKHQGAPQAYCRRQREVEVCTTRGSLLDHKCSRVQEGRGSRLTCSDLETLRGVCKGCLGDYPQRTDCGTRHCCATHNGLQAPGESQITNSAQPLERMQMLPLPACTLAVGRRSQRKVLLERCRPRRPWQRRREGRRRIPNWHQWLPPPAEECHLNPSELHSLCIGAAKAEPTTVIATMTAVKP